MLFIKRCDIIVFAKWLGVAQLVARYLGVVEAVGSSPVTQTRKTPAEMQAFFFLLQPMNFRRLALDFSLAGGPAPWVQVHPLGPPKCSSEQYLSKWGTCSDLSFGENILRSMNKGPAAGGSFVLSAIPLEVYFDRVS